LETSHPRDVDHY